MTTEQLKEFFEEQGFNVDLYYEKKDGRIVDLPENENDLPCGDIEKWTDGGVDMIINLTPFTAEEFKACVSGFDVDEEIDSHRKDQLYRKNFTIKDGLKDFTKFHKGLKKVAEKL